MSGEGPLDPPSGTASLRSAADTVPATSTYFLIFREVDLPLYVFSYLAPLRLCEFIGVLHVCVSLWVFVMIGWHECVFVSVCACVCACVRMHACMRVCVCV